LQTGDMIPRLYGIRSQGLERSIDMRHSRIGLEAENVIDDTAR
jgi:hypothetical protein